MGAKSVAARIRRDSRQPASSRPVLFHQIEERLSTTGVGVNHLFTELYQIRKQRLRIIIRMTETYLETIESGMSVRDYLASIWALTYGAAAILNSSFYQRYLGSRDTLRVAYIDQALAIPKQGKLLDFAI